MNREIYKTSAYLLLAVLLFTGGYLLGQSRIAPIQFLGPAVTTPKEVENTFKPFWETWHFLHKEYLDQPLDDQILTEGAIKGMLATLGDPNTRYLSPLDEQAARQAIQGNIEGIGAEVTSQDGELMIVAPYDGSPAEAAGLKKGDILKEADGVDLTGMDVLEAAALVRGPAGSAVHLLVERDGELFEVEVNRDVIKVPSVQGEILEEDIAYVRLSRFGNNTAEELTAVLNELITQQPQGLVLDLRSNPGGSLISAISVADQFLGEGPILFEQFGNGSETTYEADDEGLAQEVPMVVLIDEGSASASEVIAGAIRDRDRGILVGVTSFGKGTVQTWKQLSDGGGVRITIARWITPEGIWVHGEGLEPDLEVSLPAILSEESTDSQLQAAIDYLLGQRTIEGPDISGS